MSVYKQKLLNVYFILYILAIYRIYNIYIYAYAIKHTLNLLPFSQSFSRFVFIWNTSSISFLFFFFSLLSFLFSIMIHVSRIFSNRESTIQKLNEIHRENITLNEKQKYTEKKPNSKQRNICNLIVKSLSKKMQRNHTYFGFDNIHTLYRTHEKGENLSNSLFSYVHIINSVSLILQY